MENDQDTKRDFDSMAQEWDLNPLRVKRAAELAGIVFTLHMYRHVGSLTAVDSSGGMLKVLDEKIRALGIGSVRTVQWNLEEKDFPETGFDLVVSTMAFHHIKDIRGVLNRLYSVLSPGGHIAVADLEKETGDYHSDDITVEHHGFDPKRLIEECKRIGFTNINAEVVSKIRKKIKSGDEKDFPVFLLTAVKPQ